MGLLIKNIGKRYGDKKVLSNLSLKCEKGEIIGLLGLNGAGKTTLMKILTGINSKWDGDIFFNGIDLRKKLKDIQQITGYLPENNPLYNELFVSEYLLFISKLYKVKNPKFEKIISITGLNEYKNHKIEKLSKGCKQRVGIAAAIIHDPEFLILDEPTTGLDPIQIIEIHKLIKKLGEEKIVIFSSHILQEIEALCNRVILLHKGEIILDSSLEKLRNPDEQIINVTFDYRIETEAISRLQFVKTVKNTFEFEYEILFKTNKDQRSKIFDFAHDNDLKIINLQHKNKTLEEVFKSLTND
jgi:ABC-2 type transport system ATP-binding protein